MLDITFGRATDPGNRAHNEDATGVFVPSTRREVQARGWLFALADGVGGMQGGEVASSTAVQMMVDGFGAAREQTALTALLPRLVQHANAAVYDEGLDARWRKQRIATTIVACALRNDMAYIAHVGDSRCYLIRNSEVVLLTQDHSWVEEQRQQGILSSEEAADSDSRHILTRTLGSDHFVTADITTVSLHPQDILLLASDGLYGKLSTLTIAEIAARQSEDPRAMARELVREAIRRDGSDNATAMVLCVHSVEAMAMYRGRPYTRPAH